MKHANYPYSRMIIMGVILFFMIFAITGYILYFKAEKKVIESEKNHVRYQQNYEDLTKRNLMTTNEFDKIKKDYEAVVLQQQECKTQQENLQLKYDTLVQSNEQLKSELKSAKLKLGEPVSDAPNSVTSTPNSPNNDVKQPEQNDPKNPTPMEKSKGEEMIHPTGEQTKPNN